jgi:glucose/arabinose dehydrogenase
MFARLRPPVVALALAPILIATGCRSGDDPDAGPTSTTRAPSSTTAPGPTTTAPAPDPRNARFTLAPVADLDAPTSLAVREDDDALYVTERSGRVRAIRSGILDDQPVIDLQSRVTAGGEQGLLGLAFSPDGGTLYVDYTNRDGDTRVDAYTMGADGTADVASRREVLAIDQPQSNHNGGNLVTGPDGMLWIGTGDGGGGGDTGGGHAPEGNGQSLDTLLGKLLRIDPTTPSGGREYSIPPDNPFADGGGRPEIWAYGLRNPWKFSFDAETEDLVIADVGQNAWEEIDFVGAGTPPPLNFGWPKREANHEFRSDDPSGTVGAFLEYPHDGRCSISGGYVYRGTKIPDLVGTYLYSDACDGKIRGTPIGADVTGTEIDYGLEAGQVSGFGQDHDGELYVLSIDEGVYRLDPA